MGKDLSGKVKSAGVCGSRQLGGNLGDVAVGRGYKHELGFPGGFLGRCKRAATGKVGSRAC